MGGKRGGSKKAKKRAARSVLMSKKKKQEPKAKGSVAPARPNMWRREERELRERSKGAVAPRSIELAPASFELPKSKWVFKVDATRSEAAPQQQRRRATRGRASFELLGEDAEERPRDAPQGAPQGFHLAPPTIPLPAHLRSRDLPLDEDL